MEVFRTALEERNKKEKELQASKIGEVVKEIIEQIDKKNRTTQLVKSRFPPTWSGQDFEKWKIEIERWFDNNKSSDEDKYIDLMESLKKNEVIKEFVVKTLVEKVGTMRTVKRVMEVMAKKYANKIGRAHV